MQCTDGLEAASVSAKRASLYAATLAHLGGDASAMNGVGFLGKGGDSISRGALNDFRGRRRVLCRGGGVRG